MGFVDKKQELRRYFPEPFYKLKDGQGLSILLDIYGEDLNEAAQEVLNARSQFLLATAEEKYLDNHGVNLDVFRPRGFNMPDNVYRQLISIVSNSPKNIERIFERILALYFGPNAITNGIADIYSIRQNEIIVQIQAQALIIASSRDLYGTYYIHEGDNAFDGESIDLWNGSLPQALSKGDTQMTFTTVPAGMPVYGTIHIASSLAPSEVIRFDRVGNVVTFRSPVNNDWSNGTPISGPQFPDDYPSGYIYDSENRSDLNGTYTAGATTINIGVFPQKFPLEGVVYIGNPQASNFEAKGFTRSNINSTTWQLKGPLAFTHASGDSIITPNIPRNIKTTLNMNITAGSSHSELTVANAADFPLQRGAIRLAQSFGNEELVPFISRKISDNTKLIIDPNYTFQFDHNGGEKVQMMSRKTSPDVTGLQWPLYLNDTDALRGQFFNLLRRLKATGIKMVFEITD